LHADIELLSFDRARCDGSGVEDLTGQIGRLALALFVFVVLAPAASAETVAQTVRKWGLIGAWSLDCALAPDRDKGALLDYEIAADGRVVHRRNFGGTSDESEVVGADISRDGLLNLRVYFPSLKQTREYGLKLQPDGTIRAIYNRNNDDYSIRDGRFTADGGETPPQHKCK
jgi:hypothetical protein